LFVLQVLKAWHIRLLRVYSKSLLRNPAWAAIFATLCNSKTRQPIAQENCWNP